MPCGAPCAATAPPAARSWCLSCCRSQRSRPWQGPQPLRQAREGIDVRVTLLCSWCVVRWCTLTPSRAKLRAPSELPQSRLRIGGAPSPGAPAGLGLTRATGARRSRARGPPAPRGGGAPVPGRSRDPPSHPVHRPRAVLRLPGRGECPAGRRGGQRRCGPSAGCDGAHLGGLLGYRRALLATLRGGGCRRSQRSGERERGERGGAASGPRRGPGRILRLWGAASGPHTHSVAPRPVRAPRFS